MQKTSIYKLFEYECPLLIVSIIISEFQDLFEQCTEKEYMKLGDAIQEREGSMKLCHNCKRESVIFFADETCKEKTRPLKAEA